MRVISAEEVDNVLTFPLLIEGLRETFGAPAGTPRRMVFRLAPEDESDRDAFGVLPAWNDEVVGLKAFTYMPSNIPRGLDMISAQILLFDRDTGVPKALVDGTRLTLWGTAAIAGLAADYLAPRDASRLLVCGTGNLAPYMARAHLAVRGYSHVSVWGRNPEKAQQTIDRIREAHPDLEYSVVDNLESAARSADTITCATGSHDPLIFGDWVTDGMHTDFFGNHERTGRECDSALVARSRLYLDSRENVLNEAGEILIPIDEGLIAESDIFGELADLCSGRVAGRGSASEITLFKSVGTALRDLGAAHLVTRLVMTSETPGL
jgi:1-pyrroline-2-carboxylate reductase [NAD(P)H]